jgi:hypothetical protein
MVGARGACPISGATHRAPTIETIIPTTFCEIININISSLIKLAPSEIRFGQAAL